MNYLQRLIERFWKGDASEPERRELLNTLDQKPDEIARWCRDEFGIANKVEGKKLDKEQKQVVLRKLNERILLIESRKRLQKIRFHQRLKITAAALGLVALGFLLVIQQENRTNPLNNAENLVSTITKVNTSSRVTVLTLPDESKVWLNPGSKIQYARDFNIRHRNLSLEGDAKFEVHKNASKPFRVEARGYLVTALGTVFNVSSSSKERLLVKLLSGRVVVHGNTASKVASKGYFMEPGDELRINLADHIAVNYNNGSQPKASSFPDGLQSFPSRTSMLVLHFNETPISTVLEQIESIYNVSIIYDESSKPGKMFTGRLPIYDRSHSNSIEQTISLLSQESALQYIINKNQIIIKDTN